MQDSKLIEIIKLFTQQEIKSFEKFIASPYFSPGRDVSGLFNVLKKYYPGFSSDKLSKENVFTSLFPKEKFNEKKLQNLTSDLIKMAEQFLVHESIDLNEIEFDETLAGTYKDKKSDKLWFKTLNSLDKKISGLLFSSDVCFEREEKHGKMLEDYYLAANKFDKCLLIRIKHSEYSILNFLVNFLRKQRDKVVFKNGYNMDFTSPLIDSVYESIDLEKMLKLLKEKKSEWLWLIEIYYYALRSIQNVEDETLFKKFQELFYENIDKFSRKEQYFIFNDFIACIYAKSDKLGIRSTREEFEIFKKMLEHNVYSPDEKDFMSVLLYRNILGMAVSLKEYIWIEGFIKDFSSKLKPEYRTNMENLAKANLYFGRGKYENALENLSKIPYDVFIYKIDIKNLMLRIYYEMNLFDQAFSMIDAFKHFLSSTQEISDYFKDQQYKFVIIYNKLLKAKAENNFDDMGFITKEISQTESLASREWLLEKAAGLNK